VATLQNTIVASSNKRHWRVILAVLAMLPNIVRGDDCPVGDSYSASFCCPLARTLDGYSADTGGYGWHGIDSEIDGVCQGLASTNVSGSALEVLDLREDTKFSSLPSRIDIAFRPITGISGLYFVGRPVLSGNPFLIAGGVEESVRTTWDTETFGNTDQKFRRFGFAGGAKFSGAPVHIPLLMIPTDAPTVARTEAILLLRSSLGIQDAKVTIRELDFASLSTVGAESDHIAHTIPRSRLIRVMLPPDLPEAFRISVAICVIGQPNCKLDTPRHSFDILWGAGDSVR